MKQLFLVAVLSGGLVPIAGGSPVTQAASAVAATAAPSPQRLPSLASIEERWGIRILGIRLTAAGYMMDFRYHVVDASKAAPLFVRRTRPVLEDETSGSRFIVPTPPKTGALRSTNPPQAGRTYFMFFANPAKFVKPGRPVTVTIGEFRVEHLAVMAEDEPFPATPKFDSKAVLVRHEGPPPAGTTAAAPAVVQETRDASARAAVQGAAATEAGASAPACHESQPATSAGADESKQQAEVGGQPDPSAQRTALGQPSHEGHAAAAGAAKGRARPVAVTVPALALTDQNGAATKVKDLLESDSPVVLTFLFTTCTTICPVMAATVAQAQKELGAEADRIRFVSISIDPEHDSPQAMREFLAKHDAPANWQFLTGTLAQSEQLQRAFDVYRGNKMAHPPSYFIRHPGSANWWRIDGLAGAQVVANEYRRLASSSE